MKGNKCVYYLEIYDCHNKVVLNIMGIGDVVHSNTELIDISDALIQREIYPLL